MFSKITALFNFWEIFIAFISAVKSHMSKGLKAIKTVVVSVLHKSFDFFAEVLSFFPH